MIDEHPTTWLAPNGMTSDSAAEASSPLDRRVWRLNALFLALVLLLATLVIVHGIRRGEFSYNVDETQHAVTGLFFADFIQDHPWSHPVQFAYRYYAQYPALSGLIHWPPFFYVCEGIVFLLFGPSVVSARLAVLLFALVGLSFWFQLVARLQGIWMAATSTFLLAMLPSVVLFEKAVMLEIPSLALCLAATYFWFGYLEQGKGMQLNCFAVVASLALLTKQNAVYLAPFCLLTLVGLRRWDRVLNRSALRAFLVCLFLVAPYYWLVYVTHWATIAPDLLAKEESGLRRLTFYWQALPGQLGWPLLAMSLVGLFTSHRWDRSRTRFVMLMWILSCYLTLTLIGHKESRYILYWLPPFLYFSTWPLAIRYRPKWLRVAGVVVIVAVLVTSGASAWAYQRPYVSGYAEAARGIMRLSNSGVILLDTDLPGNFIFFMRALDPARRFIVLRKALYVHRIKRELDAEEVIHTREELLELLKSYGIRFVVVSPDSLFEFPIQRTLRDVLQTPQFKLVQQFSIESNMPEWRGRSLALYENLDAGPPTAKLLRLRMLTLTHDIVVPLDAFHLSWPAKAPAKATEKAPSPSTK